MAADRFVYWTDQKPSKREIRTALEDYVNGIGYVEEDGPTLFASLPGVPTSPFRRLIDAPPEMQPERWLEVFVSRDNIDVITRMQDRITCVVADGFAELCAQFWGGKLDEL